MNPRKRQQRTNMHAQLIGAGWDDATANRIANLPDFDKANRQFNFAMANPPAKAEPVYTPTPPKPPKPRKPPQQKLATQAAVGQGVRRAKKRRAKVSAADLRRKSAAQATPPPPSPLTIGSGGTGLNIGGY